VLLVYLVVAGRKKIKLGKMMDRMESWKTEKITKKKKDLTVMKMIEMKMHLEKGMMLIVMKKEENK
jgi:hypothetical protein